MSEGGCNSFCPRCARSCSLRTTRHHVHFHEESLFRTHTWPATESTGRFIKPNLTPPDGVKIARSVAIQTDNESTGDSADQS